MEDEQEVSPMVSVSGKGFPPCVWAPSLWHFIHVISLNFPVEPRSKDKKNYRKFLKALGQILPCKKCRDNFPTSFYSTEKECGGPKKIYKNRENFVVFIYKLHANINHTKTDHKLDVGLSELIQSYESFRENPVRGTVVICPRDFPKFSGI